MCLCMSMRDDASSSPSLPDTRMYVDSNNISNTPFLQKKRYFKNKASVALNPIVSLIGLLLLVAAENVITDK